MFPFVRRGESRTAEAIRRANGGFGSNRFTPPRWMFATGTERPDSDQAPATVPFPPRLARPIFFVKGRARLANSCDGIEAHRRCLVL